MCGNKCLAVWRQPFWQDFILKPYALRHHTMAFLLLKPYAQHHHTSFTLSFSVSFMGMSQSSHPITRTTEHQQTRCCLLSVRTHDSNRSMPRPNPWLLLFTRSWQRKCDKPVNTVLRWIVWENTSRNTCYFPMQKIVRYTSANLHTSPWART